ncbi:MULTISPECIES: hypothetical protein [Emticicia]|uniref:hypothetical protein n=1 Tax=Emticicia TaxID=312278 RepID=UPI0007D8A9A5|nr:MULTISPECIES: hypothetical protein [Emticicia]
MKTKFFLSLLAVVLSLSTYAQQPRPHLQGGGMYLTADERAEIRSKRMQKSLNLNEEQYKKVLEINLEQEKKNEELRKSHQAEMNARREKMKAEHEALIKKFESVLTPEQMKTLKENQEKRREDWQERRGRRKGRR